MFHRTTNETNLADFAAALAEDAVTVDVREPGEYAAGHAPGAHSIPLGNLAQHTSRLAREAQNAPVCVICASGRRSKAGAGNAVVTGSRPA